MQLILDTEPTIGIVKMSALEETQTDVLLKICANKDIVNMPTNADEIQNNEENSTNIQNNLKENSLVLEVTVTESNNVNTEEVITNGKESSGDDDLDSRETANTDGKSDVNDAGNTDAKTNVNDAESKPSPTNGIDSSHDKKSNEENSSHNLELNNPNLPEEKSSKVEDSGEIANIENNVNKISENAENPSSEVELLKNGDGKKDEEGINTNEKGFIDTDNANSAVNDAMIDVPHENMEIDTDKDVPQVSEDVEMETKQPDLSENIESEEELVTSGKEINSANSATENMDISTENMDIAKENIDIATENMDISTENVKELEKVPSEDSVEVDDPKNSRQEETVVDTQTDMTPAIEEKVNNDIAENDKDIVLENEGDTKARNKEIMDDTKASEEVIEKDPEVPCEVKTNDNQTENVEVTSADETKVSEDVNDKVEEKVVETVNEENSIEIMDQGPEKAGEKTEKSMTDIQNEKVCDKVEKVNDKAVKTADEDNIIEIMEQESEKTESVTESNQKEIFEDITTSDKVELIEEDDIKIVEENKTEISKESSPVKSPPKTLGSKLNPMNILSDDEDEQVPQLNETKEKQDSDKQCINVDDDDDIMLIEDQKEQEKVPDVVIEKVIDSKIESDVNETPEATVKAKDISADAPSMDVDTAPKTKEKETNKQEDIDKKTEKKPLLPLNFLKSAKKNLADMSRDELEEFCVLKLVESVVDRSNLSEIITKMKTMEAYIEEYKKKTSNLAKQNRDLQVVLKSVQEELKKRHRGVITPLKITRSVGMQVALNDANKNIRKPVPPVNTNFRPPAQKTVKPRQKPVPSNNQNIPVPRLVPASNSPAKPTNSPTNNITKATVPNGVKNVSPVAKQVEKRPATKQSSMTVDLTDDEPPTKVSKLAPTPQFRLVPPQNLMAQRASLGNRTVYIPINNSPNKAVRPMMLRPAAPPPGLRTRLPNPQKIVPISTVRMNNIPVCRHPAPLPEVTKQPVSLTWKPLPPAPDLKLSKVENGIVLSWKIEGHQEENYEKIASYQLYAYQETPAPPSSTQWKKIGDVKALPLPMACTLTQFVAGYKYYFAVRAVDVRSRVGPFSLPGSIILINKSQD